MPKEQLKILTEQMYYVLLALKSERCGVDITNYVYQLTNGRIHLGPGTLYTMLAKFEEEKLIKKTRLEGRKQWYQIGDRGIMMVLSEMKRMQKMMEDGRKVINDEI
ncbi:MAG: PadR family transcriptional regulator [Erysipelotrichia bacterium]|nr:PadR family transcriptional regulator [Erysipelotrichia bacterium]NCC54036.1 PadR family transcriptional regulator [Erysipelotrichia bacterium]